MLAEHELHAIAVTGADVTRAALSGDRDKAAQLINDIGETYGSWGVFLLCHGFAAGIADNIPTRKDAFHGFQIIDPETNQIVSGQCEHPQHQAVLKAMQFLMAHLNDDYAQKVALFQADPQSVTSGLVGLLAAILSGEKLIHSMVLTGGSWISRVAFRMRLWFLRLQQLARKVTA